MSATNLHQRRANLLASRDRIDAQLELLADMIREQEDGTPAPAPEPKAGTPAPKAPRPTAGGKPGPKPSKKFEAREVAAHLLAGGKSVTALADDLKTYAATVRVLLAGRPEWFQKAEPDNRLSPWVLTDQGRRELMAGGT